VVNHQDFQKIKESFLIKKGEKERIEKQLQQEQDKVDKLSKRLNFAEKARIVLQKVAQDTQKNLEYHISNLTTTALKSVSPKWPKFLAEFVTKRGKTECDLFFEEFGVLENPLDSAGGGPLDVASNSLRISYWNLKPNRPTFILDEPFKYVSPDLQSKISEMLKMLSERLGLQIIMVSHAKEINYSADRLFEVSKEGEMSSIRVIDQKYE